MDATSGAGNTRGRRRFGLHGSRGRPKDRPEPETATPDKAPERAAYYGALDLGTNNCRLLIAAPAQQGFHVKDAFSRIVRLGEGLGKTGALNASAMDRTIEALRVCSNKLVWHKVKKHRLIATEACRMASNGRGVHRPGDQRNGPGTRDHRPGDRGAAGGHGGGAAD